MICFLLDVFEPFLMSYYEHFKFKSIDSNQFKEYFLNYFKESNNLSDIDWDAWLYGRGTPIWQPDYDQSLVETVTELRKKLVDWNPLNKLSNDFTSDDLNSMPSMQIMEFLNQLLNEEPLGIETLEEMENLKLADFKRKYKNARLKDELKNTKILLQDMRASVTEMRNLKDSLEHDLLSKLNQSQIAVGAMKNELTSEKKTWPH